MCQALEPMQQRNIVQLHGFFYKDVSNVGFLLSYCNGGDLLHRLKQIELEEQPCSTIQSDAASVQRLEQRLHWALEICNGLEALHSIGAAHLVSCLVHYWSTGDHTVRILLRIVLSGCQE